MTENELIHKLGMRMVLCSGEIGEGGAVTEELSELEVAAVQRHHKE